MKCRVWAPFAKSVELVSATQKISLNAEQTDPSSDCTNLQSSECSGPSGYWCGEIDASVLQNGYLYSIDGTEPVPDPRSTWQPDGVHGKSHVAELPRDISKYQAKPLNQAVIYELHMGTFTAAGTYAAAQAKLPYLVELGVTYIELMPLATFPGGRGWGYDGVDLYAPFPAYGTPAELAQFVTACHAQGLGVLLDVVYNHLGPDGNYLSKYGPYFTDQYKTGWGQAINYDGSHSDAVRRYIIDNALMWLRDYGFDGLRLDAVHAIFSFEAVHVLEELANCVAKLGKELGRSFVLIAESDLNDPRFVRPALQGGFGLDAHWVDDFHHAVHRFFTNETDGYYADFYGLADMALALRDGYVYQGRYSRHRKRRHGRPPTRLAAHQMVVSSQNHDQIGNRAQGERLSMMLEVPQLKAIAALTLLSPFVPLLFQGEEWGARTPFLYFTDHENAELGRLVAEGRSREFSSFRWQGEVPNPQELETFTRSKLDWSELFRPPHAQIHEWYRQLIELRKTKQSGGKATVRFNEKVKWLTFVHGDILCVFNFAASEQRIRLPRGEWDLVLGSDISQEKQINAVPAQATLIFKQRAISN